MDEAWTMDAGTGSLRAVLRHHADDQSHPPLFYAMLWIWRWIGGDGLAWVRLLPALIGIATAVPILALARAARLSERATWLAIALGAGSGFLVSYSAELRNYGLMALLAPASLALWLRARELGERRDWILLTVVNVLLVHAHYFGVLIVVAQWIDALGWTRGRLRGMTLSAAGTALSLIPWLAATARRAAMTGERLENVSWIPRPGVGDPLDVVIATIGSTRLLALDLVIAVVAVAAIALWAWRSRGSSHSAATRLLLLAVVVPITIVYVASVAGPRSLWVTRYLIVVAPALVVLVAGAVDGLTPARLTPLVAAFALVPAALTAWSLQRGTEKPRYDLIAQQVAERERASTAVIFTDEGTAMIYAARNSASRLSRPVSVRGVADPGRIRAESGWYFWNETLPPPGLPPAAQLVRAGYRVGPEVAMRSDRDSLVAIRFHRTARSP
jgi:uncharacterized membrane protein